MSESERPFELTSRAIKMETRSLLTERERARESRAAERFLVMQLSDNLLLLLLSLLLLLLLLVCHHKARQADNRPVKYDFIYSFIHSFILLFTLRLVLLNDREKTKERKKEKQL